MKHPLACLLITLGFGSLARAGTEGDWFILGGHGGCWSSDVKHPATKRLIQCGRKGAPLSCVAVNANDVWIDLVGGTEFYVGGDLPVAAKLAGLWKDASVKELKCVAFTAQGGWVALTDSNGFLAEGIPPDALKELKGIADAGVEIRSVAFTPSGGWVILEGEWGVHYGGLPEEAAKTINEIFAKKVRILCTAFDYRGNWVILTVGNGVFTNNVKLPVVKALLQLRARNVPLKWVAFTPGDYPGQCAIVRAPSCRVRAVLTTDITDSSGKVEEWYIYAPQAPSLLGQVGVKTMLEPPGQPRTELGPGKQLMHFSRVTGAPKQIHVTLSLEASLYSCRLCPGTAGAADLSPELVKRYTRSSQGSDFDAPAFQEWLDRNKLRRAEGERDLSFARRAYSFIRHHFSYTAHPEEDKQATGVVRDGKSDCGGLSNLMVAVLRANRVPARMLFGRWAESQGPPDKATGAVYGQWHVKAAFFARGVGWVPLDMAGAVSDHEGGEFAHFGNDPGDFVTLSADQDFEIDSLVAGRVVGGGMQGLWWWRKAPEGATTQVKEIWQVTKEATKGP